MQEAKAAQATTTGAEPQRRALEEAQARAAALASELAGKSREIETQAAQSQKAVDAATKQKQAAESTIAELRQTLEQEQKKTAALMQEAKAAQATTTGAEPQRRALEEAQARAAALASELAGTQPRDRDPSRAVAKGSRCGHQTEAGGGKHHRGTATIPGAGAKEDCCPDAGSQGRASDDGGCRATAPRTRRGAGACRSPRERACGEKPRDRDPSRAVAAVAEGSRCGHQREAGGGKHHRGTATNPGAGAKEDCCPDAGSQGRASDDGGCRATAPRTRRGAGACRSPRERACGEHSREIETQAAQSQVAKAVDAATKQKQAAEATIAELRQSLQQEQRAETLSSEVRGKLKALATLSRQKHDEDAQLKPVSTEAKGSEAAGLLARAKALVGQGNIRAARDVLERAAEMGSAQATFALAETYDPNVLAAWRTLGTRSDATKARDLYARAYEGGIKAAKDRSHALVIAGGGRRPASWFGREEADH